MSFLIAWVSIAMVSRRMRGVKNQIAGGPLKGPLRPDSSDPAAPITLSTALRNKGTKKRETSSPQPVVGSHSTADKIGFAGCRLLVTGYWLA